MEADYNYSAGVLVQEGNSYSISGNYSEAFKCFEQASSINPGSPEIWYYKAFALYYLTRHEDSIQCCEKAIELSPSYSDPWELKGRILDKLGRTEESIFAIKQFIQFAPSEYRSRVERAKEFISKFEPIQEKDDGNVEVKGGLLRIKEWWYRKFFNY
jgi:tetratricopeptide (TPR) repeat protein